MRNQPDTTAVDSTVAHLDHVGLLGEVKATVAGLFGRRETRSNFWDLVTGLLLELPRANCWTIGEAVGHEGPHRLQHLLSRAAWDAEAVLAAVAGWVAGQLADRLDGPVVLVVDETGDEKSSTDAVGAASQYSGSLGGVGVCQVAVHLSLASPVGHAVIGRRLYLPADWAADDERRTLAGVPDETAFATKPDLALALLAEAVAAGVRADYVAADEVYSSRAFRTGCRRLDLAYVAATPANRQVTTSDGRKRTCADAVALVPAGAWARMRTGTATKGAKDYDWAMLAIEPDDTPTGTRPDGRPWPGGHSVLLARRHRYTRKISFFRCWTPNPVPLADLVAVVCARWHVEEDFQLSKRTVGLDQGQVRTSDLLAPLVDRRPDRLRLPGHRRPPRTPSHHRPRPTRPDPHHLPRTATPAHRHRPTPTPPRPRPRQPLVTLATTTPGHRPTMPPSLEHLRRPSGLNITNYNCRDYAAFVAVR